MLNKIKKHITPMFASLVEALKYLFSLDSSSSGEIINIIKDISAVVSSINNAVGSESPETVDAGKALITVLHRHEEEEGQLAIVKSLDAYEDAINDIHIQYKVVFLPYYDNTWDNISSIYEKFVQDTTFLTEIIIIPIIRNTPAGPKLVYEDYLTPNGIPNTHYDKYSFEKDQPDFVFYNNPYDGVNHPKFQSHIIKPFVGCMIYVPYHFYVHDYTLPINMKDRIVTETELPGHNSADIFIAPSEAFKKKFGTVSRNKKKMVVLGSPKSDFLFKHKTEETWQRYSEWERVLQGKTTFMLNTHYSSFVSSSEILSWLPFLLELILSNNKLSLIWRPHPQTFLMSDSFVGKLKTLFIESMDIVNKCDRIILDKTPSVVSAYMYSNALLSEYSSIITGAICIDKPVFLIGLDPREYQSDETDYYKPRYNKILNQTLYIDNNNLTLHTAIPRCGVESFLLNGKSLDEELYKIPLKNFITEIIKGNDPKGDLRKEYLKQLTANSEGCCSESICEYVKNKLIKTS